MGSEMVELALDVEEAFDVKVPAHDVTSCETPRQVIDLICSKLHIATPAVCSSQQAFYLLRRKLAAAFGIPRNKITPSTPVSAVVYRGQWRKLRKALAVKVWPMVTGFAWSGCLTRSGCAALATVMFCLLITCTHWDQYRSIPAGLWANAWLLVMIGIGIAGTLGGFGTPQPPNAIDWQTATLRDLVPYVETSDEFGWTRKKVAQTLKLIIMEHFWIQERYYHEDAHFVRDFNFG